MFTSSEISFLTNDVVRMDSDDSATGFEDKCQQICRIFKYQNIIIPYNIINQHWLLVVLDPTKKQ